ncbi:hypothetical protein AAA799E16_01713 [Marine Group I thaumarchaeote SCGC AAA799-E16]|uniref:Uncharacterized protein n=4 Tax=Marine Group I TaxID=905826 RepID=A0A081RMU8_9ARCH|nr:hypothetical protein AAA799N04_01013 [Marine Group I thaumarchaeote SCGC AAA799-N04]KER05637.1 hypothetical protein AAA799E16_01713 [Marine Group I thaumarchaeote SCGC AAA799-E16]KFM15574.1 hypothetical protein AAA799D11_01179 [Marine Group I thaumarchaeote SCGC AAA799-D11]KFM16774.1 hypothetical protein SCCGRSA3_02091 [Marine Group I thaumarchaeote SCGC RSA3]
MPVISEVINERKLWVILSTRKNTDKVDELEIVKPLVEKLNEEWFKKGDFIWAGRFDDGMTSMAIFDTTEEKAKNYFEHYSKICINSLDVKLYKWDAMPLFTILERIQGKI